MLASVWIIALVWCALWSFGVWGLAGLMSADPAWIDTLQSWVLEHAGNWLEPWWPQWDGAVLTLVRAARIAVEAAGAAAPWLTWALWMLGVVPVLLLALVLTLIMVVFRRIDSGRPSPGPE